MQNIVVSDLQKELGHAKLIDLRSRVMYEQGHIDSAINVSKGELVNNTDKYINKNETVYIYCEAGINSSKVCSLLSTRGYKVINVLGGYNAWKKLY